MFRQFLLRRLQASRPIKALGVASGWRVTRQHVVSPLLVARSAVRLPAAVAAGASFIAGAAMRAGIANFRKMLKAGKVLNANGAGGVAGSMAATTEEGMNNGVGTNTSGVGEGTESILLGPKLTGPAPSRAFMGPRGIQGSRPCKK